MTDTSTEGLSLHDRRAALAGLPDWRYNLRALHAAYACPSVDAALALVCNAAEERLLADRRSALLAEG